MADVDLADCKLLPLDALHKRLGGRMVPFAGYAMPVQYPTGVMAEHLWTRESAGLFDVSHMGQLLLEGEGAVLKNRDLMGATNPKEAAAGTIRADFADSIDANAVHGSDSLENAAIEIAYFFPATAVYAGR